MRLAAPPTHVFIRGPVVRRALIPLLITGSSALALAIILHQAGANPKAEIFFAAVATAFLFSVPLVSAATHYGIRAIALAMPFSIHRAVAPLTWFPALIVPTSAVALGLMLDLRSASIITASDFTIFAAAHTAVTATVATRITATATGHRGRHTRKRSH